MILGRAVLAGIGVLGAVAARADEVTAIPRQPPAHERYSAVGIASWYGDELRGHRTADGEMFDSQALTAAHNTLPLPCYARVTNLANGRSVVVRVNDRGPFVGGRIADVSARVATLLEFNHDGVAKIRLDYLGKAPPAGSDAANMSASLQTEEAPPLPLALIEAPFKGLGAIAHALTPPAPGPRSPYGDLTSSPFVAKLSWP
jgi:rare lipoprotein A (peptidoglycan hydrolase)